MLAFPYRRLTLACPVLPAGAAGALGVSGAEALYAPPRRAPVEAGAAAALMGNVGTNSVRVRGSVFTNWARQPALATKAEFYCRGADCGTLCTPLRHHCLKKPDLDLCPKCFKGERAPGWQADTACPC